MNWIRSLLEIRKQALLVFASFLLMASVACLALSSVVQDNVLNSLSEEINKSEETIMAYLRNPVIAFNNVYISLQDKLDNDESPEAVLEYLSSVSSSMRRPEDGVQGFLGIYGFINGQFVDSIGLNPDQNYDPQQRPWYRQTILRSQGSYTSPYLNALAEHPIISYTQKLYGKKGDFYGVLSMDLDLLWLMDYAKSLQIMNGGYGMIVNEYLYVVSHPYVLSADLPLSRMGPDFEVISDLLRRGQAVNAVSVKDVNGVRSIAFFRKLYNGWFIGVILPASQYYAAVSRMAAILFTLAVMLAAAPVYLLLRLNAVKMLADAESQAKSAFLAMMSHEIRTPLTAIIGLSGLHLRRDIPEVLLNDLHAIHRAGTTLLGIINDILDMSKIRSERFDLIEDNYNLPSLINDSVQMNIVLIGDKPITFRLDIEATLPSVLWGDELRVKQILNNLLSNAFKYSLRGQVTLRCSWEQAEGRGLIIFSVADTGLGIKAEDLGKLFTPYGQARNKANRQGDSTGLGLLIVKQLAERMGGSVEVQSEYGRGSVFTVRLRQKIVDPTPIGEKAAARLASLKHAEDNNYNCLTLLREPMTEARVLVVDDIETNLEVARRLLQPYGLKVDCARSGLAAVQAVRAGEPRYDAIFMDHMMPEMDGLEATRIIRQEIGTDYARSVPIIALTANALVGNDKMFLSQGFSAFVSKPIDITQLDGVLRQWVSRRPDEAGALAVIQRPADPGTLENVVAAGIDCGAMARRFGGDQNYLKVVESFIKHTPLILSRLQNPSSGSLTDYRIAVHGLKASARGIGGLAVGALAEQLEMAAKNNDYQTIDDKNAELLTEAHKLVEALAGLVDDLRGREEAAKPAAEKLDPELLSRLKAAAGQFAIDEMEELLSQLEGLSYSSPGEAELLAWLREQADNLEYEPLARRLAEELSARRRE
ncbi:MAG: response regulator [Candidatus Adiutrix sp.]|jgi:signal transduction histidine kinase/CheY-like chemotaxis protein|nr:response regulator [Candidatus Adiutrix sp.]